MTPLPRFVRINLGFVYAVVTVAILGLADLNLRAALISVCAFVLIGIGNYFWGWYARERMIEERDPGVEELRGRGHSTSAERTPSRPPAPTRLVPLCGEDPVAAEARIARGQAEVELAKREALEQIVRGEFPSDMSIGEIVSTYGSEYGVTEMQAKLFDNPRNERRD